MENLTIIYKGESSNTLYTAYFDSTTWYGNTKISDQYGGISPESNYGPSLAIFNNRLYMVYKGASSDDLYAAFYDDRSWFGNVEIKKYPNSLDVQSNYNPGVALFLGRLYYIYKGKSSNTLYSMSFDGQTWFGNLAIKDQPGGISPDSNYNPGVAVFNNKLYIIYKGSGSNTLYSAYFDGTKWYGNTKISDQPGKIDPQSNYSPGVAVFNNKLFMVYKGSDNNMLYSAYYDGTTWFGNKAIKDQPGGINPQTNQSPAVVIFNNRLYLIYKGYNNNVLYTAYFDGTTWFGDTPIVNQPGGVDAKSNYAPGTTVTTNPPKAK